MASTPLKGKRQVKVTQRRTKIHWAVFVKEIADNHYKDPIKITLVMDCGERLRKNGNKYSCR